MDLKKLDNHVKLCKRNLKNKKVKCCATCPFEDLIVSYYPLMEELFIKKRAILAGNDKVKVIKAIGLSIGFRRIKE